MRVFVHKTTDNVGLKDFEYYKVFAYVVDDTKDKKSNLDNYHAEKECLNLFDTLWKNNPDVSELTMILLHIHNREDGKFNFRIGDFNYKVEVDSYSNMFDRHGKAHKLFFTIENHEEKCITTTNSYAKAYYLLKKHFELSREYGGTCYIDTTDYYSHATTNLSYYTDIENFKLDNSLLEYDLETFEEIMDYLSDKTDTNVDKLIQIIDEKRNCSMSFFNNFDKAYKSLNEHDDLSKCVNIEGELHNYTEINSHYKKLLGDNWSHFMEKCFYNERECARRSSELVGKNYTTQFIWGEK